jgi:hypothetical protein
MSQKFDMDALIDKIRVQATTILEEGSDGTRFRQGSSSVTFSELLPTGPLALPTNEFHQFFPDEEG